jgi:phenylacetate-CoA ligase
MARYRMNDLLSLRSEPCPCGSPLQAVARIEGRQDDVFHLAAAQSSGLVLVTPDVVRNAVVDADRRIQDFRVVQIGPRRIALSLDPALPSEVGDAAAKALAAALVRIGAAPPEIILKPGLDVPLDRKLRRVRREMAVEHP